MKEKPHTNGEPSLRNGRPTKFSATLRRTICTFVARGLSYQHAAEASGIHRDTFHDWMRKYSDFSDAVKRARARGISERLARIEKAGRDGTWQADAWYLERVAPQHFGRYRLRSEDSQTETGGEQRGAVIILPDNGRDKLDRQNESQPGSREAFLNHLISKAEADGGSISLSIDDLLELKDRS